MKAQNPPDARLAPLVGAFVLVAGELVQAQIETEDDPDRVDHVWITVHAGEFGPVRISLNTSSLKNRQAGIDSRILLAIVPSQWDSLPAPGLRASAAFNYAQLETVSPIEYVAHDRTTMETMLLDRAKRAIFIEAWGELYFRGHLGLHQLHSRRASRVVKTQHVGRDGAVRFYFQADAAETLLFKFFGQE